MGSYIKNSSYVIECINCGILTNIWDITLLFANYGNYEPEHDESMTSLQYDLYLDRWWDDLMITTFGNGNSYHYQCPECGYDHLYWSYVENDGTIIINVR